MIIEWYEDEVYTPLLLYFQRSFLYYVLTSLLSTFAVDKSITNLFIATQICK